MSHENASFVKEALDALSSRPDVRGVRDVGNLLLELELDREAGFRQIWLAPLLLECRAEHPIDRAGWLARRLDSLLPEEELPTRFSEAMPGLTSVLRTTEFFGGEASYSSLVWRPAGPALVEVLWYERAVERSALAMWGISKAEAFAAAGVDPGCSPLQLIPSNGVNLGVFESNDGSAAARILRLRGEHSQGVRDAVGGELALALPHANLLLAASADCPKSLRELAREALKEYQSASRAISPLVYRWADGKLLPLVIPEADDELALARPSFYARLLSRQKAVLEAAEDPRHPWLASVFVESVASKAPALVSAWTQGHLPLLLPECDLVELTSKDGSHSLVPSHQVLKAAAVPVDVDTDFSEQVSAFRGPLFPSRRLLVRFPEELIVELH